MIGVVLWSSAEDGKAVFWCEDQGDLAYYEEGTAQRDGFAFFDAGDMVQFDVHVESRLRRASNARLVEEKAYCGLPEKLRQRAGGAPASGKVVPFRPGRAIAPAPQQQVKRKA